jgi:NAD(P)-dependent dehydrogenase (short-subunit alcohol dehydrogenase family)
MKPVRKQGKTSRIKRMRRPKMEFSGKVALITGGGMGIGEAIARAFAREGADIIIGDINLELGRKVVRDVERMGRKGLAIQTDVSVKVDVDRLVDETLRAFGKIDLLVNNAGITQLPLSILELPIEIWEKVTDVDYKGTYLCSRRVGKEMVRQKSGSVVNISSVIGLASAPLVAYGPAKSAVIMLTKILATEWGKYNVRVNAIAPGYTLTPLLKGMIERGERDPQRILKRTPMGKMVEPEDIAQAALFLSSEKARYITGVTLPVDAGFLADGVWSAYGGYDR